MKRKIHLFINSILIKFGFELLKFPGGSLKKRIELLKRFNIGVILDVGANTGQFAGSVRKAGYKNEIISFEPLSSAFKLLKNQSDNDKKWSCENFGLGDFDGESVINISKNLVSSSLLNIKKEHIDAEPESKYIAREKITIRKLDSVFSSFGQQGKNIFLKIDTQGFEKEVILGAANSLNKITGLQVEMSLVECYDGEMMYNDLKNLIESFGFELYYLEPGFSDPVTGKLMQIDGIFFKNR
ncbi:MAG TPA: FkbM family methyltransferase [Draconibacterium sp.]|nr:FkbM family methyltransferase [Draconibacterium sp.]